VTSLKALHKTVDGQQLTSDLGGSFPYSHEDWLQFHQVGEEAVAQTPSDIILLMDTDAVKGIVHFEINF